MTNVPLKQKSMQPLTFKPLIKQIRWGGRKLGTVLNKSIGDASNYAESWEIADQPSGQSIVASGEHAGKSLNELVRDHAQELLGRHTDAQQFPLLIKFLDANDWLSLQVHPNDSQAKQYDQNENGKTEAWVIVAAEPGSQICSGLKQGVTQEEFARHLQNGAIEETLHMIPARVGDCVFVPAQTVHALGPGILLAEVQQQSNLTFRLYDWGRMGSDGKPREIHIEQSLACIDFDRGPVDPVKVAAVKNGQNTIEEIISCEYFQIRRHTIADRLNLELDDRFRIIMILDGEARLSTPDSDTKLETGNTILLPAALPAATVLPTDNATLLEIWRP